MELSEDTGTDQRSLNLSKVTGSRCRCTLLLMGTMPIKQLELAANLLMNAFDEHGLVSCTGHAALARWRVGRMRT